MSRTAAGGRTLARMAARGHQLSRLANRGNTVFRQGQGQGQDQGQPEPGSRPFALAFWTTDDHEDSGYMDYLRGTDFPSGVDWVSFGGEFAGADVENNGENEIILWNVYTHGGDLLRIVIGDELPRWTSFITIQRDSSADVTADMIDLPSGMTADVQASAQWITITNILWS